MNSTDIQTFLEIARAGSISGAADALYASQSAISQRLCHLEEELGCVLVLRGKGLRTTELTPAGEQFAGMARHWLSIYEDMQNLQFAGRRRKITIASGEWINIYTFAQIFSDFAVETADMQLQMYTRHSQEVYRMLANHEADVGFVVRPFQVKNIRTVALFSEEMLLVCPKDTFAPGARVHPTQLNPAEELRWNYIYEYANWHDRWFDPACALKLQLDSASLIFNFLGRAGRWTIVPASVVRYFRDRQDLSYYPLSDAPPNVVYYKLEHIEPRESRRASIRLFNDYFGKRVAHDQTETFAFGAELP